MTSKPILQFFTHYWPSMIVVAVILYATLCGDPVGAHELPPIPHIDKLIHAIMMGGLVGAIAFDTQRKDKQKRPMTRRFMWTLVGAVAVFSLVDEWAQGAMGNGRSTEVADFISDVVGAVAASYIAPPVILRVLGIRTT